MNAFDKSRTALLVMDFQKNIVGRLPDAPALLERTQALLAAARAAGVRVLFVVVGFRPGYPEVSARNATFSAATKSGAFVIDRPSDEIVPQLAPRADEPIVVKRRVSAFTGSDLEVLLRAGNIDTLIVSGISTGGVVLSTTRQAADLDFQLVVARDCCADPDAEAHRVLLERILSKQATVADSAEIIAALQ